MSKTIYRSSKRGVEWIIYAGKNYKKDFGGWIYFYLLPTIHYRQFDIGYKDDQSFDIEFAWLFWCFTISRYWGEVYKREVI